MNRKRGMRSNIVPGRRPITRIAALNEVGMTENMSYLNEKTLLDESSHMNDTVDAEEREWRKKGFSENQIQRLFEARKQKRLKDAQDRLNKEKYGAKGFDEMLELPQYSLSHESDDECHDENKNSSEIQVFAIPALPKHLSEKSIMGSPVAGSKGSGKAGLSCSTPKSGNDVSMRSLRSLDISHVVSTDNLDATKTTTQTRNIMIPIVESQEESSLQKTHTIGKDASSEIKRTFTVVKDAEVTAPEENITKNKEDSSLQKTFTIAENSDNEKTYVVVESDQKEAESSLQGTFVLSKGWNDSLMSTGEKRDHSKNNESVDHVQQFDSPGTSNQTVRNNDISVEVDPPTVQNSKQGGEKRKSSGIGGQKKEKRGANMSISMMSSMIEDVPSPGANFFKNPRKKLRNTAKSPSRTKAVARLSTESDKEKTIDMLSIAEEASIDAESVSSSYVDPISSNGTRVSPIPEAEETMGAVTTTPKSSRHGAGFSVRGSMLEKARGGILCTTPTAPPVDAISPMVTPKHHYQKPTVSSMLKSKGAPGIDPEMFTTRVQNHTPVNNAVVTPLRPSPNNTFSANLNDQETHADSKTAEEDMNEENEVRDRTPDIVHQPSNDIDLPVGAMTIQSNDSNQRFDDFDMDYGDDVAPDQYSAERESNRSDSGPSTRRTRHRVGLLSDSIGTINTPGIDRRPTRHISRNETIPDEDWSDDEFEDAGRRRNGGRHPRDAGLQLKKREIIQPEDTSDGMRRSQRTRVKPVRSWLGEQPVYVNSPSGGKRLTGVTDVIIKDKRLCRYKTADLRVATEREQKAKARKKEVAAKRREQLARDHRRGQRLNESQEDIHTDDEMS